MGVKHPLELSKDYKIHEKRGGWKKKQAGREEEETEEAGEKHGDRGQIEMWEYRICILFK